MSSIIVSILLLGVLVTIHEYGHFIVAKKSGILVEEFAIGMGPKLVGVQKGETLYTIRVFPLGGFCKMYGEMEEGEEEEKSFDITKAGRSFLEQSILVRFLVIFAGPFMNFVLAFVLLLVLTMTSYVATPVLQQIVPESVAEEVGLQVGDEILRVDGKKIRIYDQLQMAILQSNGETMVFEILRDGIVIEQALTPRYDAERGSYLVGISPEIKMGIFVNNEIDGQQASLWETIEYTYYSMWNYIKMTAQGLMQVFTFTADPEDYGGPITIIQTVGESYEAGLSYSFWAAMQNLMQIGAILSANLGVMNLFPIPALDGGRLLFIGIEAVRRKPMDIELEAKVNMVGIMFIMGLMVFVLFGDIMKLFA